MCSIQLRGTMSKRLLILFVGCLEAVLFSAAAEASGHHDFHLGYSQLTYSNHPDKVDARIGSVQYDYLWRDQFELKLLARQNDTNFSYRDTTAQATINTTLSMTQAGVYFAWHKYTDWLNGKWNLHLQYQDLRGTLSDPLLGDVGLAGTGLRYENYSGSLFADLNYFQSEYNTGIVVEQWDAGAGWMFVPNRCWIQLRQFSIRPDILSEFNAVELLLQYWPAGEWWFWADSLFAAHSFGDRQLFFDPDTLVLWNNDDLLNRHQRFGVSWDLPWRWEVLAVYAHARYSTPSPAAEYSSRGGYVQLTKRF